MGISECVPVFPFASFSIFQSSTRVLLASGSYARVSNPFIDDRWYLWSFNWHISPSTVYGCSFSSCILPPEMHNILQIRHLWLASILVGITIHASKVGSEDCLRCGHIYAFCRLHGVHRKPLRLPKGFGSSSNLVQLTRSALETPLEYSLQAPYILHG